MARRRYRRYRRKSGRWASNIQEINQIINPAPDEDETFPGPFSHVETIMSNPTQQPSYVSQTFTVKNIEASFTIDDNPYQDNSLTILTNVENLVAYIMFVPQGMTPNSNYNLEHPEYIMAYKYLGSPSAEYDYVGTSTARVQGQQYQPYRIKTRLSRKLQSGDSIVLFIKGIWETSTPVSGSLRLGGLIRWWTKAN